MYLLESSQSKKWVLSPSAVPTDAVSGRPDHEVVIPTERESDGHYAGTDVDAETTKLYEQMMMLGSGWSNMTILETGLGKARRDLTDRFSTLELFSRAVLATTLAMTGIGFLIGDVLKRPEIAAIMLFVSAILVVRMWPILIWLDARLFITLPGRNETDLKKRLSRLEGKTSKGGIVRQSRRVGVALVLTGGILYLAAVYLIGHSFTIDIIILVLVLTGVGLATPAEAVIRNYSSLVKKARRTQKEMEGLGNDS